MMGIKLAVVAAFTGEGTGISLELWALGDGSLRVESLSDGSLAGGSRSAGSLNNRSLGGG